MAGGSPMASPISRWAWAKRVSESMSSSTCWPWSRKYSAMAVAIQAPWSRSRGEQSAGVATTTAAGQAFRAEVVLHEFLHLAAALADQPDDDHVGLREARHHGEQAALADAAAGEQAEPLAAAGGEQRVHGPHADVERLGDGLAPQRVDGLALQRDAGVGDHRAAPVERIAAHRR